MAAPLNLTTPYVSEMILDGTHDARKTSKLEPQASETRLASSTPTGLAYEPNEGNYQGKQKQRALGRDPAL